MNASHRITRHPVIAGALFVWIFWLYLMWVGDKWHLFADNWFMSVTMLFGSFVAGATSEGGGAVAFPVMTLIFGIEPSTARDFSLIIQSVGMVAAAFTIFCTRIRVEWRAVLYAGIGGVAGIILGLDVLSPLLQPAYTKLFFVSTWLSFGGALLWINRISNRVVHDRIHQFGIPHAAMLVIAGIVGGCLSGITGSGLDIVTFSLLVLAFRLNEKVATPTSVVLMATNTLTGLLWKEGIGPGMATAAWDYWYVCAPIVVLGAPAGALFIKRRSRHFVAGFLYLSIIVQYIAAVIIIPFSVNVALFSAMVILGGLLFFSSMAYAGNNRLKRQQIGAMEIT